MVEYAAVTPPHSTRRSGLVAIVGRPNVGKSTLLNQLAGAHISIVSRKAQTTRHQIKGILTNENAQFVFVDTPGWQTRHANMLNQSMNQAVKSALVGVDVILLVVEATAWGSTDRQMLRLLPSGTPLILVINKIDKLVDKSSLFGFVRRIEADKNALGLGFDFAATVPLAAKRLRQMDVLLAEIQKHFSHKGLLYEEDALTECDERFMAAEYVREKIFCLLGEELPYGMTVQIEKFTQEGELRQISALVLVSRASHKAMLIGKQGQKLKRIATEARREMRQMFGGKVYLEIWVKVKGGWQDDHALLQQLGYSLEV